MSNNTKKSNDGSILNSYYKLQVYLFKIILLYIKRKGMNRLVMFIIQVIT